MQLECSSGSRVGTRVESPGRGLTIESESQELAIGHLGELGATNSWVRFCHSIRGSCTTHFRGYYIA